MKENKPLITDELKIGGFFSLKSIKIESLTVYLTDHHVNKEITIDMAIDIITFLVKNFEIKIRKDGNGEKSAELDMQLTNSIDTARKSIDERLTIGDPYIKKDGEIGFKPVSCRDSTVTFGILYDKLQLTRNMPTKIVANQDLNKLIHTFEALVRPHEIVDGEVVEG